MIVSISVAPLCPDVAAATDDLKGPEAAGSAAIFQGPQLPDQCSTWHEAKVLTYQFNTALGCSAVLDAKYSAVVALLPNKN